MPPLDTLWSLEERQYYVDNITPLSRRGRFCAPWLKTAVEVMQQTLDRYNMDLREYTMESLRSYQPNVSSKQKKEFHPVKPTPKDQLSMDGIPKRTLDRWQKWRDETHSPQWSRRFYTYECPNWNGETTLMVFGPSRPFNLKDHIPTVSQDDQDGETNSTEVTTMPVHTSLQAMQYMSSPSSDVSASSPQVAIVHQGQDDLRSIGLNDSPPSSPPYTSREHESKAYQTALSGRSESHDSHTVQEGESKLNSIPSLKRPASPNLPANGEGESRSNPISLLSSSPPRKRLVTLKSLSRVNTPRGANDAVPFKEFLQSLPPAEALRHGFWLQTVLDPAPKPVKRPSVPHQPAVLLPDVPIAGGGLKSDNGGALRMGSWLETILNPAPKQIKRSSVFHRHLAPCLDASMSRKCLRRDNEDALRMASWLDTILYPTPNQVNRSSVSRRQFTLIADAPVAGGSTKRGNGDALRKNFWLETVLDPAHERAKRRSVSRLQRTPFANVPVAKGGLKNLNVVRKQGIAKQEADRVEMLDMYD